MTKFFEPINLSAVHIYHSALELSPLSSIVRRLYYHKGHITSPQVVSGTPYSWDNRVSISGISDWKSYVWSPCSQFVAATTGNNVEIRDALSSELASTLTEANGHIGCGLVYSPDGCYLACLSNTLIIWDIQTGGTVKRNQYNKFHKGSIVWSLDGKTIGMTNGSTVFIYDIASGVTLSPGTVQSSAKLHLWAHDKSFQIMAAGQDNQVFTIEIFEVGSDLTKIKSFCIKSQEGSCKIGSFSPTTYRISILSLLQFHILDVQNSECLLEEVGDFGAHCFSSDGTLSAASTNSSVHIWKYTSGHYTPWREFSTQNWVTYEVFPLQFSPTSSSVLGHFGNVLRVFQLDGPLTPADPNSPTQLAVLSPCGTYMVTTCKSGQTITITNLPAQTTSQLINTDTEMRSLVITGNILLGISSNHVTTAWRLTDEGLVDGVFGERVAGHSDSIWVASAQNYPRFGVDDQIVVIMDGGKG